MRKDQLYEIYSSLSDTDDLILQLLSYMVDLKGIDAHLFYETCIRNSNIITKENFYDFFVIFSSLCYFNDTSSKQEFYRMFNDFIKKDYINCSEDLNFILKSIANLLVYPVCQSFENCFDDGDYYILKLVEYYFQLFKRNCDDYENIYKHDFEMITMQFDELLTDLQNTEVGIMEDFNTTLLKRIELFVMIANNEKNLSLDPIKYQSVIEVAVSIGDLSELSKFRNRLKFLSNDIDNVEFSQILEQYTEELNSNTIDLIYEKLNIEIEECEGVEKMIKNSSITPDQQSEILRKILLPPKEN